MLIAPLIIADVDRHTSTDFERFCEHCECFCILNLITSYHFVNHYVIYSCLKLPVLESGDFSCVPTYTQNERGRGLIKGIQKPCKDVTFHRCHGKNCMARACLQILCIIIVGLSLDEYI